MPGVDAAGAVSIAPVTRSGFGGSFTIYGRPEGADEGNAQVRSITPGYMEALSIPLKSGRRLTAQDTATGARVALVSETAARRFWPGENPVGKQIRVHVNEGGRAPREIVGVVGDVRTRGMELDPAPVDLCSACPVRTGEHDDCGPGRLGIPCPWCRSSRRH